eukprot:INCI926.1.p2 GENE.INCI926.1~~INCI926.1.p2  ORF type:complete len:298 (+),score=89.90 INCI926.1:2031-2924(+)
MVRHFHPSVRKFAEMVVAHEEIQYSGDPFEDFTTMAFLDRFSYKKPKQRELDVNFQRGISAMQPRNKGGASVYAEDAVNSEAFVGKTARNVRPEEQFFLRYFREKLAREGARRAELDEERKAKGLSPLGDIADADADAYEDEEAFARDIAEKFMADHARSTGGGVDPDEDPDFFSDEEGAGSDEDDVGEGGGPDMSMLMGAGDDSDDDEDDDDDDEHSDASDENQASAASHQKKRRASVFASAEEFAAMLEQSGVDDVSASQVQWEDRQGRGKGARRGGGGGRGGGGRGGNRKRPKR